MQTRSPDLWLVGSPRSAAAVGQVCRRLGLHLESSEELPRSKSKVPIVASLDAYEQGRLAGRPPHLLLVPIERRDDLPTGLPPMTIVGVDGPADHAWLPGVLRLIVRVSSILQTADDVSAEVLNALTVILGHLPDAAPASLDDQALKTLQAQCQRVVSSVRSLRLLHV